MVNIINASRELNEVELYLMTIAPSIKSMKDVADGTKISVNATLLFDDVKEETGESVQILSILTDDNMVYSCQSATFKRSINDIQNIMHGKPFSVIKVSGETKKGRSFINCVLDVESI